MIKKYFRLILFSLIGFLFQILKGKNDDKINNKQVIFLGRGQSLKYFYKNYEKFRLIRDVVIINFTKQDISGNLFIFKKKRVHVVMNIVEDVLSLWQIFNIKFGKVFISRFYKNDTEDKSYSLKRKDSKANLYGNVSFYCDRKLIPFNPKVMGAGFLAVVYFVIKYKIKKAYLFGFDFYQEGLKFNYYSRNDFKTKKDAIRHQNTGKKNIKLFHKFVKSRMNTIFYFPAKNNAYKKLKNFKLMDI